tara:strand:- start:1530 stop:1808 length:279 start_codon:yes stop_codon:yes gene_type:complete
MSSKRKVLKKVQLGILPSSMLSALGGATPETTTVEETTTVTPVRAQVETAIEAFREDNPILPEPELTTTKNTRTRRARKPTAKKTTKTKKSS